MSSDDVFVGYPVGTVDSTFHAHFAQLLAHDARKSRRIRYHDAHATTNIPHARNQIVRKFLDSKAEWLWFVDTDQTFTPDVLDRLLARADARTAPIVGALVFSYDGQAQGQKTFPTIWSFHDGPARWGTVPRRKFLGPQDGVNGTGTGCVVIHRSVFQRVADELSPDGVRYGDTSWPWFKYGDWRNAEGNADVFGEDLTFFLRCHAAGIPVHIDTGVVVGHHKRVVIDESVHFAEVSWDRLLPETYVVIPVRDRLDLTKQIVRQLKAQGGYDGLFIYDNGSRPDTRQWLSRQNVEYFDAAGAGIYEMWNAGIREAAGRWPKANVVILNNDLDLGDGFLDELTASLRGGEWAAVGANYDGRTFDGDVQRVKGICAARYDGTGGLPGFAFAVRGELFARGLPLFDEQFRLWYGDNDWLLELDRRGLPYGIVKAATCVHLDGGSQTTRSHDFTATIAADEAKFRAKWAA